MLNIKIKLFSKDNFLTSFIILCLTLSVFINYFHYDEAWYFYIVQSYDGENFYNFDQNKTYIQNLNSTNSKVQGQVEKALAIAERSIEFIIEKKKTWYGNTSKDIKSFDKAFSDIMQKKQDSTELEDDISFLLSQIKYNQIGEALKAIENIPIRPYRKYSFMPRDFGFSYIGAFEEIEIRREFLSNYEKFNELELYKYYLKTLCK